MLSVLAAATLHPSPLQATFRHLVFSGNVVCVHCKRWVSAMFKSFLLNGIREKFLFSCLDDSVLCSWSTCASGQDDSQKDAIHQMYHLLADVPASCFIVLWVKTSVLLDWKYLLNTLSIFISDVPQDTLAIHCSDRSVALAAMKSMVHTLFRFRTT